MVSSGSLNPTLSSARQWAQFVLGRALPADDGQRRHLRILHAALANLGSRGIAVLAGLVTVPLTVGYLGAECYGVWMTMGSVLSWINVADLGLGNGLTNALARSQVEGRPERARAYVSAAFWTLSGIAAVIGIVAWLVWPWLDWAWLFNVRSPEARAQVGPAAAVALALFLVGFPFSIVNKVHAALQEGALASWWSATASVLSLLALVAVTRQAHSLGWLVFAASGALLLATLANGAWLFGWHKRWLRPSLFALRRETSAELAGTGSLYFTIQIATLLLFQTDNVIIARWLGPEQVTPYNVAWRLFSYTTLLQIVVFPYLWPAYAEAFARRDLAWIRRTFRLNAWAAVVAGLLLSLPLVLAGRPLIRAWAGESAVPPASLLLWMAAWSVVYGGMSAVACLLNGSGQVRGLTVSASLTAVTNLALSILFARRFGLPGVMAGTVVAYLLFSVVPVSLEARRVVRRLTPDPGHGL
jgi:O-antigen/teichoic acid export membrane protein